MATGRVPKLRKVAGLILAAGASTRLGTPKQLLPVGDSSLLDRVLLEALSSNLHRVYLVLGYEADRIRKELRADLRHPKLTIVHNPAFEKGMSSSILLGLVQAEPLYDDIMIILADMPFVNRELIDRLLKRYLESGQPLAAVRTRGKRSHPVVINRSFYDELRSLRGDVGARHLFSNYPGQVCFLDVDETCLAMDIDTGADYQELLRRWGDESPE